MIFFFILLREYENFYKETTLRDKTQLIIQGKTYAMQGVKW